MKQKGFSDSFIKPGLLLLIPLFYLAAGFYFRLILEDPSLRSVDPDYVYFCTGLNMAEGEMKVAHIDHPGTPLQLLTALVFRLVWWFRGTGGDFTGDILQHSDLYLQMVNLAINLIIAGVLLAAGRYVFRKTASVTSAMLIQTIPLLSFILYEIIGRVSPEQILALPIIALTLFLIAKSRSGLQLFSGKEMAILALITGFGLSIKLTLLPLLLFPLIIVPGWKKKAITLALSFLIFLILAFPATLQIGRFTVWISDLFLYSGQYGSGEKNVVDLAELGHNFAQMVKLQPHFSIVFLLMTAAAICGLFHCRRNQPLLHSKAIITVSILLAVLLHALIAGKQYAPRYIMPALMYGPLLIFLLREFIIDHFPLKPVKWAVNLGVIIFLLLTINSQIPVIRYTSQALQTQIEARNMTRRVIDGFEPGSLRIIATSDYGSPFPEYALNFFTAWAPQALKEGYHQQLEKIYPGRIIFTPNDGQLRTWGEEFNPEIIISDQRPVYLYLENNSEALYNQTIARLSENQNPFTLTKELLFENPQNGELIYQLHLAFPQSEPETEPENERE